MSNFGPKKKLHFSPLEQFMEKADLVAVILGLVEIIGV